MDADAIAAALVDRLIASERKIEALKKTVNDCFSMIAENQARVNHDGTFTLRAMDRDAEVDGEFELTVNYASKKTI